jgi:hypothetical protein
MVLVSCRALGEDRNGSRRVRWPRFIAGPLAGHLFGTPIEAISRSTASLFRVVAPLLIALALMRRRSLERVE